MRMLAIRWIIDAEKLGVDAACLVIDIHLYAANDCWIGSDCSSFEKGG